LIESVFWNRPINLTVFSDSEKRTHLRNCGGVPGTLPFDETGKLIRRSAEFVPQVASQNEGFFEIDHGSAARTRAAWLDQQFAATIIMPFVEAVTNRCRGLATLA